MTPSLTVQDYARVRLALKYVYSHLTRYQDTNPSVSAAGSVAMRRTEWVWPIVSNSKCEEKLAECVEALKQAEIHLRTRKADRAIHDRIVQALAHAEQTT